MRRVTTAAMIVATLLLAGCSSSSSSSSSAGSATDANAERPLTSSFQFAIIVANTNRVPTVTVTETSPIGGERCSATGQTPFACTMREGEFIQLTITVADALAWQANSVKVALSRARKLLADCVQVHLRRES